MQPDRDGPTVTAASKVALFSAVLLCSSNYASAQLAANDLFGVDIEQLMSIPVYAATKHQQALRDTPGVALVVSRADWLRYGASNLVDVLRRLPGAYPVSTAQFRDNLTDVRGQHSGAQDRHVLFLINGHPYREAYYGGLDRALNNAFPLAAIERVEYIRGPASALYGSNAFSAVINIVTRLADADTAGDGLAEISRGSFDSSRASLSAGGNSAPLQWQASLQYADSAGWPFEARDVTGKQERVDFGQRDRSGWLDLRAEHFHLQHFENHADLDVFGLPFLFPVSRYERRDSQTNLGYQLQLPSAWTLDLNYTELRMADTQHRSAAIQAADTRTRNQTLEATFTGAIGNDWQWLFGAEQSELSARAQVETVIGQAPEETRSDDRWLRYFAQFEYAARPDLQLLAGVTRSETRHIDPVATPRAALVWTIGEGWRAKLLHGQAFRAPYLVELYNRSNSVFGDPDLHYEEIRSSDAQLSWEQTDFYASITLFRSRIDDAIVLLPDNSGNLHFTNATQLESRGGELEGFWQPNHDWRLDFSFSRQLNRNQDGVANTQISPNNMTKLGLWHRFSDETDIGLWDSYFSAPVRRETLPATTNSYNPDPKSYHHLTLALNYRFALRQHASTLSLFIDNAGEPDAVYHTDYAGPGINTLPIRPGRSVYATLSVAF